MNQPLEHMRTASIPALAKQTRTPERTLRRLMHRLNRATGGRLLVQASDDAARVGKWLVCLAVLDELLPPRVERKADEPPEDEDDPSEDVKALTERVGVLERRTNAHRGILRDHKRKIEKQQKALEAFGRAQTEVISGVRELASR